MILKEKGRKACLYNHIPIIDVLWMRCFVSAAPISIFMGGFTKTTENLNQRGSLSTIQTQDSLNVVCDYKASYHITKIWWSELATPCSLAGGTCHLSSKCLLCLSWLP